MAREMLPDDLWNQIEPLLPPPKPKPKGGRPRVPDRAVLTGILFVLDHGIPWEMLPQEMGCGCGMTCWRRLREWRRAGVWGDIRKRVLEYQRRHGGIDWTRAAPARRLRASGGVPAGVAYLEGLRQAR